MLTSWTGVDVPYQDFSRDHDESKQIAGAFNKLSLTEKTKTKTKGTPAEDHEVAEDPQEAANLFTFTLDADDYKVFKALFFITHDRTPLSVITQPEFETAKSNIGFGTIKAEAWDNSRHTIRQATSRPDNQT